MSRRVRPHLPGATFHVTTRVHHREALFTPELRTTLVGILWEQVAYSDIELFAYVIMSNHLHLVLRQGDRPLSHFMQPFLTRAALLIQRSHRREGHVFERRFRDQPCIDSDYIRNAIVYTHLNPVRAGLCNDPSEYAWSSHNSWANIKPGTDPFPYPLALSRAIQLFANAPNQTPHELSLNYLAFLAWRQAYDQAKEADPVCEHPITLPARPVVGHGDESWVVHLTKRGDLLGNTALVPPAQTNSKTQHADLGTIAIAVQRLVGPGLDPDTIRSRWGGAPYVRVRHEFIRRAAALGYRGVEIATFLRISPSAVYDVIGAARK